MLARFVRRSELSSFSARSSTSSGRCWNNICSRLITLIVRRPRCASGTVFCCCCCCCYTVAQNCCPKDTTVLMVSCRSITTSGGDLWYGPRVLPACASTLRAPVAGFDWIRTSVYSLAGTRANIYAHIHVHVTLKHTITHTTKNGRIGRNVKRSSQPLVGVLENSREQQCPRAVGPL